MSTTFSLASPFNCLCSHFLSLLYTIGETPLTMPDGVGISVGGESGFNSFRIEYQ
jgi:hypothetical protein